MVSFNEERPTLKVDTGLRLFQCERLFFRKAGRQFNFNFRQIKYSTFSYLLAIEDRPLNHSLGNLYFVFVIGQSNSIRDSSCPGSIGVAFFYWLAYYCVFGLGSAIGNIVHPVQTDPR